MKVNKFFDSIKEHIKYIFYDKLKAIIAPTLPILCTYIKENKWYQIMFGVEEVNVYYTFFRIQSNNRIYKLWNRYNIFI